MDITVDVADYKLNVRAAGVIIHNNKVLFHRNHNSDYYALVGGRVEIGEDSESTIKREFLEETGKEIDVTGYVSTLENFFESKGKKYHEILFVYQAEFVNEADKTIQEPLKNIEGKDYLTYEWVNLNEIDQCPLKPSIMKNVLKEQKFPVHKIMID